MNQLAQNKANAIAFYKMAYEGQPKQALDTYLGNQYIQHNPDVADGIKGISNACKLSIPINLKNLFGL